MLKPLRRVQLAKLVYAHRRGGAAASAETYEPDTARVTFPHHRDFGNSSKLSRAKQGKHYRSDPVRVQST